MKIYLFIFLLITAVVSCTKNDPLEFESSAKIIGEDLSECVCCGGWIIEIDGNQNSKRFNSLPKNTTIDLQNSTFPILVNLNWTATNTFCNNGITIDAIELK